MLRLASFVRASVVLPLLAAAVMAAAACGGTDVGGDLPDATTGCVVDSQCDDGNDCTLDQCLEAVCAHEAAIEGEPCDDGLACTQLERCEAGVCAGAPLDCGAQSDFCNTGVCDEAMGGCVLEPVADGTSCDDGMFCTDLDSCQGGACEGAPRDCAGGDACTAGVCNEAMGACETAPIPDGGVCDDGLFCTTLDSCTAGVCAGVLRDCATLDDTCNAGVCDEGAAACVTTPINEGGACDDGLFCTTGDSCTVGACNGVTRDCSGASDACNVGVCDEAGGACLPTPANEGAACDDGQYCTTGDLCTLGACGGAARDCSAFGNACNLGACDEISASCMALATNEGGACDDGLYCSTGDQCSGGTCAATGVRTCSDGDTCTSDSCDEGADACANTLVPVPGAEGPPGGTSCTDGVDNDCDGLADLADANCTGCTGPGDCDDGNACTTDVCTTGVCANNALTGPLCDDGLYCTTGDACAAGACTGAARDCSVVGDACNVGACSEATDSCVPTAANEGGACDDGLYCTAADACAAGTCVGGGPRDCSAFSGPCATGSCDEAADGCFGSAINEGLSCTDGLYCSTGDTCAAGVCAGGVRDCSAFASTCNSGACNEAADSCFAQPLAAGTVCDAAYCLSAETCNGAGACSGGTAVTCSDGMACTSDLCDEASDMCQNPARVINAASVVASSSDDGTPLTACLTAGSAARVLVWTDLRDTTGVPIAGASVTIGGVAATASAAQPGIYWREVTATAAPGVTTLAVAATACASTVTLSSSVTITQVAANASLGGTGGCSPTDGNVRVRVIAAETGAAIAGASVLVGLAGGTPFEHAPDAVFGGPAAAAANVATTDAMGYANFYDYNAALAGPITVTAGAASRAYFTVADGNAADLVLALPLLHPPAIPTTLYNNGTASSSMTWPPTASCSDIDMGLAMPKLELDFFAGLRISSLFQKNRCWDSMNGNVGVVAVPENILVPAQSIGLICLGGSVAAAPWSLALKQTASTGVTENIDLVMASAPYTDVQTALSSGGLTALLPLLTYRRIGFSLNETVAAPVSGRNIAENETFPNNYTVTYSGRPPETDVIGVTLADYAGTNGSGPLLLIGTDVHEWDVGGSTVTIPNSDLNAAGTPAGVRRLASVTASYLDPTMHPGIAANRLNAKTTMLLRDNGAGMAPFGTTGGAGSVTRWLGLAGTTYSGTGTFTWENATANGNQPQYSVHELTVRTQQHLPVLSCQATNEVRDDFSVQWIVVRPFAATCGLAECFTLPTLPATFPRAIAAVQQRSGFEQRVGSGAACTGPADCVVAGESCVDPDAGGTATASCMGGSGTAAAPYTVQDYYWRLHAYDLELAPLFDFNAFVFGTRLQYMTHESSNAQSFP